MSEASLSDLRLPSLARLSAAAGSDPDGVRGGEAIAVTRGLPIGDSRMLGAFDVATRDGSDISSSREPT